MWGGLRCCIVVGGVVYEYWAPHLWHQLRGQPYNWIGISCSVGSSWRAAAQRIAKHVTSWLSPLFYYLFLPLKIHSNSIASCCQIHYSKNILITSFISLEKFFFVKSVVENLSKNAQREKDVKLGYVRIKTKFMLIISTVFTKNFTKF